MVHNQLEVNEKHEPLVVGLYQQNSKLSGLAAELDHQLDGQITELIKSWRPICKRKLITKVHTLGRLAIKRLYFVGLGKEKEIEFDSAR